MGNDKKSADSTSTPTHTAASSKMAPASSTSSLVSNTTATATANTMQQQKTTVSSSSAGAGMRPNCSWGFLGDLLTQVNTANTTSDSSSGYNRDTNVWMPGQY